MNLNDYFSKDINALSIKELLLEANSKYNFLGEYYDNELKITYPAIEIKPIKNTLSPTGLELAIDNSSDYMFDLGAGSRHNVFEYYWGIDLIDWSNSTKKISYCLSVLRRLNPYILEVQVIGDNETRRQVEEKVATVARIRIRGYNSNNRQLNP